jgi:chitin synthase
MAYNHQRLSTMSSFSGSVPRQANGQSAQVSVQTLLNALHTSYFNGQPHSLEASTSLVVNTWQTAQAVGADGRYGGTTDQELARKAWEHARRRAEDACIILGLVA